MNFDGPLSTNIIIVLRADEIIKADKTACISPIPGTAFVNFGNFSRLINGIQIYDPSDYVIPPQETSGFFVMTNMIVTPTQQQSKCPENPKFKDNW